MIVPESSDIMNQFMLGNGVEYELSCDEAQEMHEDLLEVGMHLSNLPLEKSFAWTEDQPMRRSCWLVAKPDDEGFISTEEGIEEFDGDQIAGERGLQFLQNESVRGPLHRLKQRADMALNAAALAIGVPEELRKRCSTRYRIIYYQNAEAGIGTHFDGNGLSAVLTNHPGLREVRYDGVLRDVPIDAVSVMPGSSVHRLTRDTEQPFLPTFHDVRIYQGHAKTSMAAFWNFPDKELLPGDIFGGADFYHDINAMKYDDGPKGTLRYLWETVAKVHGVSVETLAKGQLE